MNPPSFALTKDGNEQIFATNVVGHFALTLPLLPLLMRTEGSRVVSVSSFLAQESNGRFDNALRCDVRPYNSWRAYSDSKLANLLFARMLAQKLESAGMTHPVVVASHPGITASNLQRHVCCLATCCGMSIDKGALTQMRAAVDPTAKNMDYFGPRSDIVGFPVLVSGRYCRIFCDCVHQIRMPAQALKDENAQALWALLASATMLDVADYLPKRKRNKRRVRKLKEVVAK
jgi:NAD(P)-dependent dehydrogenase (short-subunit alcohol dehydrogenase family)